ncbi:VbhA domain-containing protein [Pseudomonas sp. IT-232MI5]
MKIPAELALLIIRKASAMAATFEEQALDQLTKDALQALRQGADPQKLIREMRL